MELDTCSHQDDDLRRYVFMALQEFAGDETGHHLDDEKEETVQFRFRMCMKMCVESWNGDYFK